jgi:hypothetical protein
VKEFIVTVVLALGIFLVHLSLLSRKIIKLDSLPCRVLFALRFAVAMLFPHVWRWWSGC